MSTGLSVQGTASISGYTRSQIGALAKVPFSYRTIFFQLFLPFPIPSDSHHLETCLELVSPYNSQRLLSAHVTLGLREKSSGPVFWGRFFGNTGLFVYISCLRFRISFLDTFCHLLDSCCSDKAFAERCQPFVHF